MPELDAVEEGASLRAAWIGCLLQPIRCLSPGNPRSCAWSYVRTRRGTAT